MAKAKKLVKASALANLVCSATENLATAVNDGMAADNSLSRDKKKLVAEKRRLAKKRTVLTKKKTAASARLKKTPNAETRKAVATITKELAAIKKTGDQTRAVASANAEELKAVKATLKQATAYLAVIEKADKILNKPKKKRRTKKRATRKTV